MLVAVAKLNTRRMSYQAKQRIDIKDKKWQEHANLPQLYHSLFLFLPLFSDSEEAKLAFPGTWSNVTQQTFCSGSVSSTNHLKSMAFLHNDSMALGKNHRLKTRAEGLVLYSNWWPFPYFSDAFQDGADDFSPRHIFSSYPMFWTYSEIISNHEIVDLLWYSG